MRPDHHTRARGLATLLLAAAACGGGDEIEVREAASPPAPLSPPARAARRAEPELPEREPRTQYPSGLAVEILEPGEGRVPAAPGRRVTMHHEIRLAEGEAPLESTRTLGIPYRFTLGAGEVVPGLDRGLVGARAGDRLRLRIPATLAYGASGMGTIPAEADLVVDVEILEVQR